MLVCTFTEHSFDTLDAKELALNPKLLQSGHLLRNKRSIATILTPRDNQNPHNQ